MHIHDKPKSQWRGMPEIECPVDDTFLHKKAKRKRNFYHSITHKLRRRISNGLKDWHYKIELFRIGRMAEQ